MVPAFGPLASQVFLSKRPPGDRASPAPFWGTEQALERFIFNLPRLFSSERTPGDIRDAFTALSLTGVPVRPIGPLVAPLLAGRR